MAFPTTSVLDDFNRADSGSLGANWTAPVDTGDSMPNVVSNTVWAQASPYCDAYWNVSTFSDQQESFITITTLPTAAKGCGTFSFVTGTTDAYEFWCVNAANSFRIYQKLAGAYTQLGADGGATIAAGDSVGGSITGSGTITLDFFRKPSAGSWGSTPEISRTDATPLSGSGTNIGLALEDGAGRIDDFGGGDVVTAPPPVYPTLYDYSKFPKAKLARVR